LELDKFELLELDENFPGDLEDSFQKLEDLQLLLCPPNGSFNSTVIDPSDEYLQERLLINTSNPQNLIKEILKNKTLVSRAKVQS
jgi:hypothetical protein